MRTTASVVGILAVAVALAACSAGGSQPPAGGRSGTSTATVPSRPVSASLMTGIELRGLLLGQGDMPGGFKLNPKWTADSGSTLYPVPSGRPTPPSSQHCVQLTGAPWLPAAGLSPVSFAANGYRDVYNDEIDQMIAVYPRAAASQAVMANLDRLFALCSRFPATTGGQKMQMTLTRSAGPPGGDDSIKAIMTSSAWQGGETLVAIRVANTVVSLDYSSSGGDLGSGAAALAMKLAARLRAAQ